jgi:hypothetical protein
MLTFLLLVSLIHLNHSSVITSLIGHVYQIEKYFIVNVELVDTLTPEYCSTLKSLRNINCSETQMLVCSRVSKLLDSHHSLYCENHMRNKRVIPTLLAMYLMNKYMINDVINVVINDINEANKMIADNVNGIKLDVQNINLENHISRIIEYYVHRINQRNNIITSLKIDPGLWYNFYPGIQDHLINAVSSEIKRGSTALTEKVFYERRGGKDFLQFVLPIKPQNATRYNLYEYVHLPKIRDENKLVIPETEIQNYIGKNVYFERGFEKVQLVWKDNETFHIVNSKEDLIFSDKNLDDIQIWFMTPFVFINKHNAPSVIQNILSGEFEYTQSVLPNDYFGSYVFVTEYICVYFARGVLLFTVDETKLRWYLREKCTMIDLRSSYLLEYKNHSFRLNPSRIVIDKKYISTDKIYFTPTEITDQHKYATMAVPVIPQRSTWELVEKHKYTIVFCLVLVVLVIITPFVCSAMRYFKYRKVSR